jgi:hypothetical protein
MAPRLASQQGKGLPSKSTTYWDAYTRVWFVRVRRAELLRICCARWLEGESTEASYWHDVR